MRPADTILIPMATKTNRISSEAGPSRVLIVGSAMSPGSQEFCLSNRTLSNDPKIILKYLARDVSGDPISDRRLVSWDNGQATFMACSKEDALPGQAKVKASVTISEVRIRTICCRWRRVGDRADNRVHRKVEFHRFLLQGNVILVPNESCKPTKKSIKNAEALRTPSKI